MPQLLTLQGFYFLPVLDNNKISILYSGTLNLYYFVREFIQDLDLHECGYTKACVIIQIM